MTVANISKPGTRLKVVLFDILRLQSHTLQPSEEVNQDRKSSDEGRSQRLAGRECMGCGVSWYGLHGVDLD